MSNQSLHLLCRISNPPVALSSSRRSPFPSPSLPLCLPSRRLPFPSPTLPVARASVPSPSVRLVPLPSARPLLSPSISLPVAHAFPVNSLSVALAFPVISLSVAHAFPVALPSTARRPRLPSRLPSHLAHKSPYVFSPYSLLSLPLIIAFLPPPFPSSPCPLPFFPMSPSLLPHVPFPSSPCPLPFFPMSPSLLPHVPCPAFLQGLLARRPTLLNPDISRARPASMPSVAALSLRSSPFLLPIYSRPATSPHPTAFMTESIPPLLPHFPSTV
ncbi:unnamed protein product [Closterium sp. NIES-64]|nr:unnamed protein product [Closterium sp. NIES-64]